MAFPEISSDWFLRDEGEMLNSKSKELVRINSLLDTIATLQDAINLKSETIATLTAKIDELKQQLNN